MLIDLLDLRYCLHNKKGFFWKNILNKPGGGWFTKDALGFLSSFHQWLLEIVGASWFTKRAPGFLSRLHQWQLKIPGAGWFAGFEIIVCKIREKKIINNLLEWMI